MNRDPKATESFNNEVTQLLLEWGQGDHEALDKLMPMVYRELHKIARRYLRRERAESTLQTTALVNEAYLKLVDQRRAQWHNRAQFFGIAAQLMRRIIIDHARQRMSAKRGGGQAFSLDGGIVDVSVERASDLIALDDALKLLAQKDPQKSRIVELRYFGGLSIEETAEVLGVGTATVIRQWRMAKAWLFKEIAKA